MIKQVTPLCVCCTLENDAILRVLERGVSLAIRIDRSWPTFVVQLPSGEHLLGGIVVPNSVGNLEAPNFALLPLLDWQE
jgi:hypothetical protein